MALRATKTTSRAGNRFFLSQRGFTLFELLAVVFLLAIVFTLATTTIGTRKSKLRSSAQDLTAELQALSAKAIQSGKIHRAVILADRRNYRLEIFVGLKKKPKEEDREAYAAWEQEQRDIDSLPVDQRMERTRLDRGAFKALREKALKDPVIFKTVATRKSLEASTSSDREPKDVNLLFHPSGEAEEALIVLDDGQEHYFTLKINPLSGVITALNGEVSEKEWKEEIEKR